MKRFQAVCDCGGRSPVYERLSEVRLSLRHHRCEQVCVICRWATPIPGRRGLCHRCYRSDSRQDAPLSIWRRDELLDEWDLLRREGHTVRQAAERLGMTFAALDKALCRAKGDPRARRTPSLARAG